MTKRTWKTTTANRKYHCKTFWLYMFGPIAKRSPTDVRIHANQPLSKIVAFGYWTSRAESKKFVAPCCTPGTTAIHPAQFHQPVIHDRKGPERCQNREKRFKKEQNTHPTLCLPICSSNSISHPPWEEQQQSRPSKEKRSERNLRPSSNSKKQLQKLVRPFVFIYKMEQKLPVGPPVNIAKPNNTGIPETKFMPYVYMTLLVATHVNRNWRLEEKGIRQAYDKNSRPIFE